MGAGLLGSIGTVGIALTTAGRVVLRSRQIGAAGSPEVEDRHELALAIFEYLSAFYDLVRRQWRLSVGP